VLCKLCSTKWDWEVRCASFVVRSSTGRYYQYCHEYFPRVSFKGVWSSLKRHWNRQKIGFAFDHLPEECVPRVSPKGVWNSANRPWKRHRKCFRKVPSVSQKCVTRVSQKSVAFGLGCPTVVIGVLAILSGRLWMLTIMQVPCWVCFLFFGLTVLFFS